MFQKAQKAVNDYGNASNAENSTLQEYENWFNNYSK